VGNEEYEGANDEALELGLVELEPALESEMATPGGNLCVT
jgi:hypothetical protein